MAILDRARSLAGTLGKTAQKGATRAKLELDIRNLEGKLKNEYAQLGRVVYSQLKSGESVAPSHPDVAASVQAIDALQQQLEEKRAEIERVKEDKEGEEEQQGS